MHFSTLVPRRAMALVFALCLSSCAGGGPGGASHGAAPLPASATTAPPSGSHAESTATPVATANVTPAPTPTATSSAQSSVDGEKAPAFTGTLLGKPFAARSACVIGTAKEGWVSIEIYDVKDFNPTGSCAQLPAVVGARSLSVRIHWKTGAKADFAAFAFDSTHGAESEVAEFLPSGKYERKWVNRDFHPKGSVEVLKAVNGAGKLGRVRLSLEDGTQKLAGEIDVYSTSDFY